MWYVKFTTGIIKMKLKHLYNSKNFFCNVSVPHNTHIQFFNSTIHIVNSDGSNAWGKCIIRQNKIFKKIFT